MRYILGENTNRSEIKKGTTTCLVIVPVTKPFFLLTKKSFISLCF